LQFGWNFLNYVLFLYRTCIAKYLLNKQPPVIGNPRSFETFLISEFFWSTTWNHEVRAKNKIN